MQFPNKAYRVVEAGWCRKQATDLSGYSAIGAHYLAALPRKNFGAGHENCKPKFCVANNVDENLYAVAHTSKHCQCQLHEPELPKVIHTIKDGDITLISISLAPEGDPRLTVLKASPDVQYTVTSHVWIGDLGKFSQNQLPRRQLLRIHSLLKSAELQTQAENLFKPSLRTGITFFFKPISDLYGLEC